MEERGGRIREPSLNCVWEIDSQLNDGPILVTWLAASLGFPAIAHVIPCVSETKCKKPRSCAGWVIAVPRPGRIRLDPTPKC